MRKNYEHIFFDLDRTLWDFAENATLALNDLFVRYRLEEKGVPDFGFFLKVYKNINHRLWKQLRDGEVTKDFLRTARFRESLLYFGVTDKELAEKIGHEYVKEASAKKQLISGAKDILDFLYPKYTLHIISNGFQEAQYRKLENCDISQYFDQVILSEEVGVSKPHKEIFEYALEKANATIERSIMVGDDAESDIKGALNIGMDCIYFNPHDSTDDNSVKPTFIVQHLTTLKEIF